ncbi:hypothetical protein ACA910_005375 [Epithemia clementina (nom. ined.)]
MVSSTTTTALRWRARLVKDALQPELVGTADDSRIQVDGGSNEILNMMNRTMFSDDYQELPQQQQQQQQQVYEDYSSDKNTRRRSSFLLPTNRFPFSSLLCRTMGCVGRSGCCGCLGSSSKTTTCWYNGWIRLVTLVSIWTTIQAAIEYGPRSWYMALYCTCTVTLCAGIWYQLERLDVLRNIRDQVRHSRQAQHRLSLQVQVQFRQLETLEWQQAALQQSAQDLQSLVKISGRSVEQWQRVAHEWRTVQAQLQQALHQQVQQQMLAVVLECDVDRNFELDGKEWQLLQVRLNAMPGLELILDDGTSSSNSNSDDKHPTKDQILLDDDDDDDDNEDDKKGQNNRQKKHDFENRNRQSVIETLRILQQHEQQQQRKQQQQQHSPRPLFASPKRPAAATTTSATIIPLTPHIRVKLDPQQALLSWKTARQAKRRQQQQQQKSQAPPS